MFYLLKNLLNFHNKKSKIKLGPTLTSVDNYIFFISEAVVTGKSNIPGSEGTLDCKSC